MARDALLLANVRDSIIVTTLDGIVTDWNEGATRLYGFEASEMVGRSLFDRVPEFAREEMRAAFLAIRTQGEFIGEWQDYRKDGTPIWIDARVRQFTDAQGRPLGIIGLAHEITERKRAEMGLRFLAEAGTLLSSSLDYEATLSSVAQLAVPRIADWCVVDMVQPDGSLRRLAIAHNDPLRIEQGWELTRRFPPDPNASHGPAEVVRTGRPKLTPEIDDAVLAASIPDEEHRAALRALGLRSLMSVPLESWGRIMGVLTLMMGESGRRYSESDLSLADSLARRAALAVDNARLYGEARSAARHAEESLALLDTLMTTAPVGLAFMDRDLRYVRINDALAAIDGISPEDAIGRTHHEIVPDLAPRIVPLYQKVLETGEPITNLEISGQTTAAPGVERHWLVDYYPVRIGEGEVLGVGVVVTDISEQKRVEQVLRESKESAEAANRSKDDFLAALSHELRTPLTPVLVSVTALLEDPETPASLLPTLEVTRRNVALEARLIDDLLDVTRITQGKLRLNRETVNAHGLIRQALEICRDEIATGGLELTVELDAPAHHVEADPARLQQVFWNLIKNAVKFTPPHGRLTIRSRNEGSAGSDRRDSRLIVEVIDSGIGIDPEFLPLIFKAFEQGGNLSTRQFGGLGLGLAITKSLVEAHGGLLSASSEGKDRGATFRVELETVARPEPSSHPSTQPPHDAPIPSSLHILLVEDNVDTLRALSRLLTRRGYHVRTASCISQAMEALEREKFDLLVSDIGLPDGSGLDLMRRIRARNPIKGIALSGFGMDGDVQRSRAVGYDAHLIKPIDFRKLEETIRDVSAQVAQPTGDTP